MEFPQTSKNFNPITQAEDIIKLEFDTENVNVFSGYFGHHIVVRLYLPDLQPGNPYKWKERNVKNTDRITNGPTNTVITS